MAFIENRSSMANVIYIMEISGNFVNFSFASVHDIA